MLDKAFDGPFVEGQTQSNNIDFAAPMTFAGVQLWMYIQSLDGLKDEWRGVYYRNMYRIWILADRLLLPKLQNEVMAKIVAGNRIPASLTTWLYDNTVAGSKLRLIFAHTFAALAYTVEEIPGGGSTLPTDLVIQVLLGVRRKPCISTLGLEHYLVEFDVSLAEETIEFRVQNVTSGYKMQREEHSIVRMHLFFHSRVISFSASLLTLKSCHFDQYLSCNLLSCSYHARTGMMTIKTTSQTSDLKDAPAKLGRLNFPTSQSNIYSSGHISETCLDINASQLAAHPHTHSSTILSFGTAFSTHYVCLHLCGHFRIR